jgi:hypothetical protein
MRQEDIEANPLFQAIRTRLSTIFESKNFFDFLSLLSHRLILVFFLVRSCNKLESFQPKYVDPMLDFHRGLDLVGRHTNHIS